MPSINGSFAAQGKAQPRRVGIGWKLLISTAVVGGVAAAIAILGLIRMQMLNDRFTRVLDVSTEKVRLADLVRQDLVTVTRAEQHIILADTQEQADRHAEGIDQTLGVMHERVSRLRRLADKDDVRDLDRFAEEWQAWVANHYEVREYAQLDSSTRARALSRGEAAEHMERLYAACNVLRQRYKRELERAAQAADRDLQIASGHRLEALDRIVRGALQLQRAERDLILAETDQQIDRYASAMAGVQEEIEAALAALEEMEDIRGDTLKRELQREDERELQLNLARQAFADYQGSAREIVALVREKGNFLAEFLERTVGLPLAAQCEALLDAITEKNELDLLAYLEESRQVYTTARDSLVFFSLVGILVSLSVSFYTGQRIATNLRTLGDYAEDIRRTGDLSKPVPRVSRDEVGELAAAFDEMRSRLYEQTSELAELNKSLKHQREEMEQFVYTVSHDLSSPLVSCKGLIGLIKEDLAEGDYHDLRLLIDKLDGATDQLRQIIDDLLTLSRVGRKSPKLSLVDMRTLLERLKQELADRLKQVGAELRIDPELPPVVADASQANRVFENLLTNAIKYGCQGNACEITVGGVVLDNEVRYFVRDRGPGIEPAYHQKIFGLFQRLESTKPGTGLGLASVMKIMRMHNGRAWVQSRPGEGATFWVAFPQESHPRGGTNTPNSRRYPQGHPP